MMQLNEAKVNHNWIVNQKKSLKIFYSVVKLCLQMDGS